MIGQSLKEYVDLPDELVSIKTVIRNGETIEEPFLKPNLTDRNGNPINYRQYILKWQDYLKLTPLIRVDDSKLLTDGTNVTPILVTASLASTKDGMIEKPYISCGSIVPKGKWIKYSIQFSHLPMPMLPYTVKFRVENHGQEAHEANQSNGKDQNGDHCETKIISTKEQQLDIHQWEHAAYRGLHYMTVEVYKDGVMRCRARNAIFIE
jgi:hypothetical protein